MKIVYYSRPNCVYCDRLESFLKTKEISATKLVLDVDFTREELLAKVPKATTFPVVLVDDKFIGGFTQFVDWHGKQELS